MANQRVPRVFISYSHDTVRHQERVLELADRLRADGIDAEIDQYNQAPREGWPLWCQRQIQAADFVLMVCTATYRRRVVAQEGPGEGLGVVWETQIIRQLLYDAGSVSDKIVPVLFSDGSPEHIPPLIKGWTWYVADSEGGYEELYRRLTGQPRILRPELGPIRALPPRTRQWPERGVEEEDSGSESRKTDGGPRKSATLAGRPATSLKNRVDHVVDKPLRATTAQQDADSSQPGREANDALGEEEVHENTGFTDYFRSLYIPRSSFRLTHHVVSG